MYIYLYCIILFLSLMLTCLLGVTETLRRILRELGSPEKKIKRFCYSNNYKNYVTY